MHHDLLGSSRPPGRSRGMGPIPQETSPRILRSQVKKGLDSLFMRFDIPLSSSPIKPIRIIELRGKTFAFYNVRGFNKMLYRSIVQGLDNEEGSYFLIREKKEFDRDICIEDQINGIVLDVRTDKEGAKRIAYNLAKKSAEKLSKERGNLEIGDETSFNPSGYFEINPRDEYF